jgi:hypothetical protein
MWIRVRGTRNYKCVSPAVGKHLCNRRPNIYLDKYNQVCKKCGANNHHERKKCHYCGEALK